jgi:hypothetical protein
MRADRQTNRVIIIGASREFVPKYGANNNCKEPWLEHQLHKSLPFRKYNTYNNILLRSKSVVISLL